MSASFILLPFWMVRFISLSLSCTGYSRRYSNLEWFLWKFSTFNRFWVSSPVLCMPYSHDSGTVKFQSSAGIQCESQILSFLGFMFLLGFGDSVCSFNKYVLSSSYTVPSTFQGASVTSVHKTKIPALKELIIFSRRRQKMNHKYNKYLRSQ